MNVRRLPRDARLPALGLVTIAMSEDEGDGDPIHRAWRDLCHDTHPNALIPALVEVAGLLLDDLELYTGADPLWSLQRVARRLQRQGHNAVAPYFTIRTPDPAHPGTEREEPTMALLNRKPTDAPVDPHREALQKIYEGRPTINIHTGRVTVPKDFKPPTRAEMEAAAADTELHAIGGGYDDTDPDNPVTRLPEIDRENRDDAWFTWSNTAWIEATDNVRGQQFARGSRFMRARGLAYLGRLNLAEVEHIRYLATSDNPFESLSDPSQAFTPEQARILLDHAEARPQYGRYVTTNNPEVDHGFTNGLDEIWSARDE